MLNTTLLQESFELVVNRRPDLAHRFYEIFFERYPQVRSMFGRGAKDLKNQEEMLTLALVAVIEHLEDPEWLTNTLHTLGARHIDYGVRDEMYGWVGECLLATLSEVAGPEWTPEVAQAWTDAFAALEGGMLAGANAARAAAAAEKSAGKEKRSSTG